MEDTDGDLCASERAFERAVEGGGFNAFGMLVRDLLGSPIQQAGQLPLQSPALDPALPQRPADPGRDPV